MKFHASVVTAHRVIHWRLTKRVDKRWQARGDVCALARLLAVLLTLAIGLIQASAHQARTRPDGRPYIPEGAVQVGDDVKSCGMLEDLHR